MKENEHVKTAIRWHRSHDDEIILEKLSQNILGIDGKTVRTYMFDHIIDCSDQSEVYNLLVKPLVEKTFEGYDCTFIATGQTGSGKTYTMGFESSVNQENCGMTARVLNSIFSYQSAENLTVLISFIEVYNDQAFDLLGNKPNEPIFRKNHQISEATKLTVKNEQEVLLMLSQCTRKRHVRETKMNPASSRSHAIFSITIGMEQGPGQIRKSVINLVDLAGSECSNKTGNTGTAQFEGKNINESLSAFKRVICAMSRGESHIPNRESALTGILKDSLKNNCYLTLLGCVSPYRTHHGETMSTLSFVSEAKLIKKTPQVNAVISEFQKSKTPVKNLNSSHITPFKRTPLHTSFLQNERGRIPKFSSEPRRSFIAPRSSLIERGRILKYSYNSTTKKLSSNNVVNSRRSFTKRKGPLFPVAGATASRSAIEDGLHNESMNIYLFIYL